MSGVSLPVCCWFSAWWLWLAWRSADPKAWDFEASPVARRSENDPKRLEQNGFSNCLYLILVHKAAMGWQPSCHAPVLIISSKQLVAVGNLHRNFTLIGLAGVWTLGSFAVPMKRFRPYSFLHLAHQEASLDCKRLKMVMRPGARMAFGMPSNSHFGLITPMAQQFPILGHGGNSSIIFLFHEAIWLCLTTSMD